MLLALENYKPNTKDITKGSSLHVNPEKGKKVDSGDGRYKYKMGGLYFKMYKQINENKQFDYNGGLVIRLSFTESCVLLDALKNGTETKSSIFHSISGRVSTLSISIPSEFNGKFYTTIYMTNKNESENIDKKHRYSLDEAEKSALIRYIEMSHVEMATLDLS